MTPRAWAAAAAILTSVVLFATACGKGGVSSASAQAGGTRIDDWARPLADGVAEPSINAASKLVAFHPVTPRALGRPTAVYVDDPTEINVASRMLALVFRDPSGTAYWVLESPARATELTWRTSQRPATPSPSASGTPGSCRCGADR